MTLAEIKLWGRRVAAVKWHADKGHAEFQYDTKFAKSGIQLSPIAMPLTPNVYRFPSLNFETFKGLPGLLADSLPDRFGNALINTWLARQGRLPESFNPVERLCYTGTRGMGALEFYPTARDGAGKSESLNVAALVELASEILTKRGKLEDNLDENHEAALANIIRVGTSAGGARAKAVIAYNKETGEVRSGEANAKKGFQHWLLKFDGVANNKDKELSDPKGFGRIEYAYYLMARAAGIDMMECQLLEENGRAHFLTRRFDRPDTGGKLHVQSLGGMGHFDFNMAGAHSYEEAFLIMKQLNLPVQQREQQFLRTMFNVMSRNQDDHVKNIAFLMNKKGEWSLSPAFDVTYAYNPEGDWTHQHQMTINGKQQDFLMDDFHLLAQVAGVKHRFVQQAKDQIAAALERWIYFAEEAGVSEQRAEAIANAHRHTLKHKVLYLDTAPGKELTPEEASAIEALPTPEMPSSKA